MDRLERAAGDGAPKSTMVDDAAWMERRAEATRVLHALRVAVAGLPNRDAADLARRLGAPEAASASLPGMASLDAVFL